MVKTMTIMDVKRNFVTEEATGLFLTKPISSVTIKDVAKKSGVGEATVYRYFSGRTELLVACAVLLQKRVEEYFFTENGNLSGYEQMAAFYNTYYKLFSEHPEYYRFLEEFDAYCLQENVDGLEEYADNMDKFKTVFDNAYKQGTEDQTICFTGDIDLFYYTTTHAVLALCKKLGNGGGIVRQDMLTEKGDEIKTLINIILFSLKNRI